MNVIPNINSVLIGACGADGAMGSSLTELIYVKKDSVTIDFPEREKTGIYDGKSDDPFTIIRNAPETLKNMKFMTTRYALATLQLDGWTSDSGNADAPILSETTNEKSVRFISNAFQGEVLYIDIPRADLEIRPTGTFTNKGELLFEVTVSVISPRDGSDEPLAPVSFDITAADGRVATPVISQDGNNITITCATSGATIVYTINGLNPLALDSGSARYGTEYSTTFAITGDCQVRAGAYKTDLLDSHLASLVAEYTA